MSFQNPFKCNWCSWRGKHVVGVPSESSHSTFRCSQCFAVVEHNECPDCKNLKHDCPTCQLEYDQFGIGRTSSFLEQRLLELKRSNDPSYQQEVGAIFEWKREFPIPVPGEKR